MVTIFHGEDLVASRRALTQLRSSYNPNSVFSFSEADLADLVRLAEGLDLFSQSKLIIIEFLKTGLLRNVAYLPYLENKPETTHVAFWIGETLLQSSALLKTAEKNGWRIKSFNRFNRTPVFGFVDALFSRNLKSSLGFLQAILNSDENLFGIISLITTRLRGILWLKFGADVSTGLKPYLLSKSRSQVRLFSESELVELTDFLRQVDLETKTGLLEPSLGLTLFVGKVCLKDVKSYRQL